jgi:hypothetical protein
MLWKCAMMKIYMRESSLVLIQTKIDYFSFFIYLFLGGMFYCFWNLLEKFKFLIVKNNIVMLMNKFVQKRSKESNFKSNV